MEGQRILSGYLLFDLGNKRYKMISQEKEFTGSLSDVIDFALYVLGFDKEDLDLAIKDMDENIFDSAAFGIRKKFMYAYDRERNNEKLYFN